jgi:hypothetical protein
MEAVRDFENQPEDGRYHDAATVALSWLLRADPNALAELSHLFDLEGSVTELRNRLSHLGGYGCEKALAGAECEEVLATIQEAIAISRRLDQTGYASIDVLLDACLSGLGPSLSTYVRAASKSQ